MRIALPGRQVPLQLLQRVSRRVDQRDHRRLRLAVGLQQAVLLDVGVDQLDFRQCRDVEVQVAAAERVDKVERQQTEVLGWLRQQPTVTRAKQLLGQGGLPERVREEASD